MAVDPKRYRFTRADYHHMAQTGILKPDVRVELIDAEGRPFEREPMAIDVEFAPGGDEAWAVVGDRKESVAGGTHPTRLVVISWETGRFFGRLAEAVAGAPDFASMLEEALVFARRAVEEHDAAGAR